MGNADKRILNPRKTILGARGDSLENTVGASLHDGAQCYVIGEQANYRFLLHSRLPLRPPYVIQPIDAKGQWVRESGGLFGVAMLSDGKLSDDELRFVEHKQQFLVQFEVQKDELVYVGTVPRLALIDVTAHLSFPEIDPLQFSPFTIGVTVVSETTENLKTRCEKPGPASVVSSVLLRPGARIFVDVSHPEMRSSMNALHVILL